MEQIAETMNDLEVSTGGFLEGAARSQSAAQNLDALTAGLTEATARYRVATVETDPTRHVPRAASADEYVVERVERTAKPERGPADRVRA